MNTCSCIALLGRRDEPTDGVRDYCFWLSQALQQQGVTLRVAAVNWESRGWLKSLCELWGGGEPGAAAGSCSSTRRSLGRDALAEPNEPGINALVVGFCLVEK